MSNEPHEFEDATTAVPTEADVAVIGAGLSGLAAARHLQAAGLNAVILEASDGIGGRVRSDHVDGFTIDRGFQVIATAYPELQRLIDLDDLDPRPFTRGLGVFGAGRVHRLVDPSHDPSAVSDLLTLPLGSILERMRAARYAAALMSSSVDDLASAEDVPVIEAFQAMGLSRRTIERLLRPFLSGVLLDGELTTSRRFVDLALRTMLRGEVIVPARGMQQLPRAIASRLTPGSVFTGVDALRIDAGVVRHNVGTTKVRAVVVATDPMSAHVLLPTLDAPAMRAVTTLYHSVDAPPSDQALLLVDGEQRLIVNSVVMTNVAPEYATNGRALIATSVLGAGYDVAGLDLAVRERLEQLYATSTRGWDLVAARAIPAALPAMPAPHNFRRPVRVSQGVFVAGDHRDSSSIQGALVSGRRAASAVLDELGSSATPSQSEPATHISSGH